MIKTMLNYVDGDFLSTEDINCSFTCEAMILCKKYGFKFVPLSIGMFPYIEDKDGVCWVPPFEVKSVSIVKLEEVEDKSKFNPAQRRALEEIIKHIESSMERIIKATEKAESQNRVMFFIPRETKFKEQTINSHYECCISLKVALASVE